VISVHDLILCDPKGNHWTHLVIVNHSYGVFFKSQKDESGVMPCDLIGYCK
jgi:hypothetical protein